jgi:zeta-carotene desaturase
VIRELFLNSAYAGAMGMSTVPLSELYAPVKPYLEARGGCVLLNTTVEGAEWDEAARSWKVKTRNSATGASTVQSDFVIAALPFEAMGKLIPLLPPAPGAGKLAEQVATHTHWPICSVHLWFDREITALEHAVLLDREIHWMYNQSRLQGRAGHYIELVVSATRAFAALPREAAIAQALAELAEFFPRVREATVVKAALIKEVRATFGVAPGIDTARPQSVSPWPQFFLAGDWIQTGWPSTMESAARSGHMAADAIVGGGKFLAPEMKPRGIMRWWS